MRMYHEPNPTVKKRHTAMLRDYANFPGHNVATN